VLTIAYLANQFPSPVEPYVGDEIEELRGRGIRVIAGSVRRTADNSQPDAEIVLQSLKVIHVLRACWLCLEQWRYISWLIGRILCCGSEGPIRRAKTLIHTWLGACYAAKLKDHGAVDHVHAHHGYYGSWIAMVAARLLGAGFSMTLHGSDLLLRGDYLDIKLANCVFCLTVSEYNRQYILECYPDVDPQKVVVLRLGVEVAECSTAFAGGRKKNGLPLTLLAVGRLHKVKDHAFLVRVCAQLRDQGVNFECSIAGDGPERHRLESLIRKSGLDGRVTLLGHIAREQMGSLYDRADVVVLTSRSEGIPLVLMEAMARAKVVLAPAITGIPELVQHRKTGFLYEAGSIEDFLQWLLFIHSSQKDLQPKITANSAHLQGHHLLPWTRQLSWVRHAAQVQIRHNFNRKTNLKSFGDLFLSRISAQSECSHENSVLQQIQLSLQRNRSVSVRIDGIDASAGARSSPVFHG
jgi:colanic acid/amylovoran biosynthesis glycosyltransferase